MPTYSLIGSFAKTKKKLERVKLNPQRAKQKSASDNEELWINSLVPLQQLSGLERSAMQQLFKTSALLLLRI